MSGLDQKNILVVEDDPIMVVFLEEYLASQFNVTKTVTGEEALDKLNGGTSFQLVLLDIQLPGISGFEVIESIRSRPELDKVAVLVLSGSEKSEDRIQALTAGADDFVVKPFNPQELSARVNNLLRRFS